MLTTDTNYRGYSVIPLTDLGLDDLTTWLRLSNTCYTDTYITGVEYLGVTITLDAEQSDYQARKKRISANESPSQETPHEQQCYEAEPKNNTHLKSEVSQSLQSLSLKCSDEYPVTEHDKWGTCPRSLVHKQNNTGLRESKRRSSRSKEISELEQMKRSILSKSFLNLRHRDFFSRSMSHLTINKFNKKDKRQSQSAKDLLFQRNYSGQCIVFESQQVRNEIRNQKDDDTINSDKAPLAARTEVVHLPIYSNKPEKYEQNNKATRKQLISSDPRTEHMYCKECQIRNPGNSMSGDTIAICTHTENYNTLSGVNNKNYLFHPLDRLFKRRSNTRKRRKISRFSLTLFLCGCSKRSFR